MPRPWRIQWEGCWYHVTFWERNVGPCAERFKSTPIYRGVKLSPVMNVLTIRQRQAPDHPAIPASRWALALLAGLMLVLTFTIFPFHIAV